MGDHRSRSRARIGATPASAWPLRALGRARHQALAAPADRPRAAARSERRPVRPAARRAERRTAAPPARTASSSAEHHPTGVLSKKVFHADKRVHLDAAGDRRRGRAACARGPRCDATFPLPPDRHARAALAQLLDAQRAQADAGRPRRTPLASTPTTPAPSVSRTASRAGSCPPAARSSSRPGHRRGLAGDDRRAARLGSPWRLAARQPRPAGPTSTCSRPRAPRGPRAPRRHGVPQRHPGSARGGLDARA